MLSREVVDRGGSCIGVLYFESVCWREGVHVEVNINQVKAERQM